MNGRTAFVLALVLLWTISTPANETDSAREELLALGIRQIVFVKRPTYQATNFYTEHINGQFQPGGNICILNVENGQARDLCPELADGMVERLDLSWDAQKIVFSWKENEKAGYRLYEIKTDGTGLRRVLVEPTQEERIVKRYSGAFRHGTDDLSPCYLPDGNICFVSTRCQYSVTCDAPAILTTSVLYRCDANGQSLLRLSNNPVSEMSPSILSDGRILFTRWEYVDKGSAAVKCLWVMNPDGTASSEIFGNNITYPPTLIFGREIPDEPGRYVCTGAPHSPYTAFGPILRIDRRKNIRSPEAMESLTPTIDIRAEYGWLFRDQSTEWSMDLEGIGPLFQETYPITDGKFLVSHKPRGKPCNATDGYGLYLLNERGDVAPIYRDPKMSCWNPIPLRPRPVPPVIPSRPNLELADRKLAEFAVADIYNGMENVERGTVRFLRVLEQVPRPWSARRPDFEDEYDQQHAVISRATHLILKVQHGVVPVEEDGSAHFYVPADANIYLQALDANYRAIQTERTAIHSMPGEVRSCVGCHEKGDTAPPNRDVLPRALRRAPDVPAPQPGETNGKRPLDYRADVQPIWNRHCVECHGPKKNEGRLDLSDTPTRLFCVSYENLVPDPISKNGKDFELIGRIIRENYPKTGNTEYLPPRSLGSLTSPLVAMLARDDRFFADPIKNERITRWLTSHPNVRLSFEEQIQVTNWIDTNCQYYGSYFGRRHLQFQDNRDFRPASTFEDAVGKRELPLEIESQ